MFFYFFFLFCKLYCLVPEKILPGKLNSVKPQLVSTVIFGAKSREKPQQTKWKERKKEYLIPKMMNSCSLSWASYSSFAWGFRPNGEVGAIWFAEFFVIFWVFQPNGEADKNALSLTRSSAPFHLKWSLFILWLRLSYR